MPLKQPSLCALILAAGYGTRLKEVGEKTPKGLFKNPDNLSILDLILKQLSYSSEISQIALVTNDRFFHQYQDHISTNYPQLNIKLINDDSTQPSNRLGSLGDLHFAIEQLKWWNKNLLVLPSDRTPEDILSGLTACFIKHQDSFIVCIAQESKDRIKNKSGCAVINENLQVIQFEEKPAEPKGNYLALPFYIFPQTALRLLKKYKEKGNNMDSPGNIVPWLITNNFLVQAFITKHKSFDIGDLNELEEFQERYKA